MNKIRKRKVNLEELYDYYNVSEYTKLADRIKEDLEQNRIAPVIASKQNGKRPALYFKYYILEEVQENIEENTELIEELKFQIDPSLRIDYYMKNLDKYIEDRKAVLLLNEFLMRGKQLLSTPISLNERSYQIWKREKYLDKGGAGGRILKNLGLTLLDLNIYLTTEPLAYYSHNRLVPQNVLIVENKDTFYSMRKHLLEGHDEICGTSIGTLIYGGGKKIQKSFQDFSFCVEPYINDSRNRVLYFGDIDYEGINIFESFYHAFTGEVEIEPFVNAYVKMLEKEEKDVEVDNLPDTKEGQKPNGAIWEEHFLQVFPQELRVKIKDILEERVYIPQECLNITDY
ncbi:Wadjet anti-phage system protein JetD domain-containing protein [Anaeromicropila herbilytica]|uniref:Wadjet protein JetD C-terminal domain-containing protein n=1 Tax=Anaeromicropila herbilytica TaxID=2785025 RepID=A0A7R7EM60_9FIRM|nr:Wadjet anti-phage system protein JetD domain-containing protein [Anaeromicropila herbilytica]BCN31347.1 hypothetical protein bsdtb5_26420 [Anaeromicropila herbilytica]